MNISGINYTSGVDNNIGNNRPGIPVMETGSANDAGITLLRQMSEGTVFSGTITDITQNRITIALSDNASVTATLSNALSYNIGDFASFSIKENLGEQIILQSHDNAQPNLMNDQTITTALKNANVEINSTTVELVKNLMSHGLPIDSNTVNQYVHMLDSVPTATPSEVVYLSRLSIPLTEENLQAFRDFNDFNNGISNKLDNLNNEVFNIISSLSENSTQEAVGFIREFVDCFSQTMGNVETLKDTIPEKVLNKLAADIEQLVNMPEQNSEENVAKDNPKLIQREALLNLADKVRTGDVTAEKFLNSFTELSAAFDDADKPLKEFLKSDGFKKLLDNFTRQEMLLKPEEFSKDNLKRLYAKIINDSNNIASKFSNGITQGLATGSTQIANEAVFMNELNNFMSFIQIPLKLSGQNGHGDLYVYSNRKHNAQDKDELKAMLHLDMDNLGPMDIFVRLQQNNVSTSFKVESDEVLNFVETHMDELTKALNKAGYNVSSEVKLSDGKYNFTEKVVNEELKPAKIKRFSFDVRA